MGIIVANLDLVPNVVLLDTVLLPENSKFDSEVYGRDVHDPLGRCLMFEFDFFD